MPGPIRRRLAVLLFVSSLGLMGLALAEPAIASTAYLRPNEDLASTKPWTVVGTSSAWDALDDNVTETETPSSADYITASTDGKNQLVGLQTIALGGATSVTAEAWIYSTNSNKITFKVIKSSTETVLVSGTVAKAGWSSLKLPSGLKQSDLDNVAFKIQCTSPGTRQVNAAFLKLTYVPSQTKVYWGARMDGEVAKLEKDESGEPLPVRGDAPWDSETWDIFEKHTAKPVSIVHFGQPAPWTQEFAPGPLELASERGAIPAVSMSSEEALFSEISKKGGAKEAPLRKWAKAVKEYGQPFFFRWDWEMNLSGPPFAFPWAEQAYESPDLFKAAWRRFHDIAEEEGATNITWVWCPNVSYAGSTSLSELYPGNSYVDWICMDGYNHGKKTSESGMWTNFDSLFSGTYAELTSSEFAGHSKPIMIGETGTTESGGSKAEWIGDAFGTYLPSSFPNIKAVVWFNWNITEGGTEWDWPIESSTTSTTSFSNAISSPYYAENTFGSLTPLTKIQPLP